MQGLLLCVKTMMTLCMERRDEVEFPNGRYLLFSRESEAVMERLDSAVPFFFERPREKYAQDNPYRLIATAEAKRLLGDTVTKIAALPENASDYECFDALVSSLPSYAGSGYYRFVRLLLECRVASAEGKVDLSDTAELWRAIRSSKSRLFVERIPALDLSPWLFPEKETVCAYDSSKAFGEALALSLATAGVALLPQIGENFRYPDPYHAEQAFASLKADSATEEDREYHLAQMLRTACAALTIPLVATVKDESAVEPLVRVAAYLKRNRMMPRALLLALPFNDDGALRRILAAVRSSGLIHEIAGVVPTGLPYASAATVLSSLRVFAQELPIGLLTLVAEGEACEEAEIHGEGMKRILASYLALLISSGEITMDAAETVGRMLLFENPGRFF